MNDEKAHLYFYSFSSFKTIEIVFIVCMNFYTGVNVQNINLNNMKDERIENFRSTRRLGKKEQEELIES